MRTISLTLVAVSTLAFGQSGRPFQVGWYSDVYAPGKLAAYARQGMSLVLADGAGWFYPHEMKMIQAYLDEAAQQGIGVILPLGRGRLPVATEADFETYINRFKSHPALAGYYLSDEPERGHDPPAIHERLLRYYSLAKALDPAHPQLIVFCGTCTRDGAVSASWADVADWIGVDLYPGYEPVFGHRVGESYDVWKRGLEYVSAHGRQAFVPVLQGFGINPHDNAWSRDFTIPEMRYQAFSAIVLGIGRILFWYEGWTNPVMSARVAQMVNEIQQIGAAMKNGISNDPQIRVSAAETDLAWRFGSDGDDSVLLAVNIAARSTGGRALPGVIFRLPVAIRLGELDVVGEERTVVVKDGVFTDDFDRFAVHAYRWKTARASP